ncbi:uncharacterized protein F4807DRAFT_36699 [Annulohypoxylon truncatum]|uniref:uncharacterized protein n=1 Tax=Annulohypoxylon truncatum TaxID=327061 RepID=UPI002008B783|nr:uncharacterized protein F4807DRAFT_36699 [Annulohypoxylon truncatum]KAI1211392.1 hypothetical protein F4807DRAFT_36699 [Annulohypoxylon truncatum]
MNVLTVGHVLTGIGGSGIYLGSLVYFTSMMTKKERGFYVLVRRGFLGFRCRVRTSNRGAHFPRARLFGDGPFISTCR